MARRGQDQGMDKVGSSLPLKGEPSYHPLRIPLVHVFQAPTLLTCFRTTYQQPHVGTYHIPH